MEEHELQKEKIQEDYNDKYWDQRYTLVQQQIPSFLQKIGDKILSTGEERGPGSCSQATTCPDFREVPGIQGRSFVSGNSKYFYGLFILTAACWSTRS